ncbi:isopentenyl-diphosphate Delta-isomerase [Yoonia sp. 208BN28-4]|uniref:isopentenyl-diphosphate Delta-isomerase n=1 Tax=Yoonia sp. 208BN28-4 TaxID=3126505 RepID=UPI003094CCFC
MTNATTNDTAGIMIPTWVNGDLRPYDKLAAHVEGLRHKAVSVFVMAGDKVLIQQRAAHKYHTPELWANTCCTHPSWGEDEADCAVRRLQEELGIAGLTPSYRGHVEYRADVGGGLIEHEEVDVFVADTDMALTIAPNPDEVMATAWVGYDDLIAQVRAQPERFTPWLRIYLEKHRDMIFGVAA